MLCFDALSTCNLYNGQTALTVNIAKQENVFPFGFLMINDTF